MIQYGTSKPLRRVKAILHTALQGRTEDAREVDPVTPRATESVFSGTCHRIVRVFQTDPWGSYEYIRHIDQIMLARKKMSYFELVHIRQYSALDGLGQQIETVSTMQHPSLATMYDVYYEGEMAYVVSEYLDISIAQLNFQKGGLDEWEIATIITEVLKGVTYVSSMHLSCRHVLKEDIRMSMKGEIKLLLNLQKLNHDHVHETPRMSQVLLDFPVVAELIEEMMVSRYHYTSVDESWSEDALSFLDCSVSGSLENLINHSFLHLASSPKRLIPRIRFAYEASR